MTNPVAFTADRIFDGREMHQDACLIIKDNRIESLGTKRTGLDVTDLGAGILAPGLVDLQVNGGGGVMLNDGPSADIINQIEAAHLACGTTSILPTLITAPLELTQQAIAAAQDAAQTGTLGLHLEGPHLDPKRKGAHRAEFIRPMDAADLEMLCEASRSLPSLLLTVAPESVTPDQATRLRDAGATVFLGHSDTDYATACAMKARGVTHLFNAMSGLGHREPGLVGAALDRGDLFAGLIADGIHVSIESIGIAMRAKQAPGALFLVSDAMATVGSDIRSFHLDGREIFRGDGRLVLADGTLAGADIDLLSCVRFMHNSVGTFIGQALAMATSIPAKVIGRDEEIGHFRPGARADFIHISTPESPEPLSLRGVWKGGIKAA